MERAERGSDYGSADDHVDEDGATLVPGQHRSDRAQDTLNIERPESPVDEDGVTLIPGQVRRDDGLDDSAVDEDGATLIPGQFSSPGTLKLERPEGAEDGKRT